MTTFKLPDLGEGLMSADIIKWHVKEGSYIKKDDILVTVETAKAMVDIPSPITGIIEQIFIAANNTATTGATLVSFDGPKIAFDGPKIASVVGQLPTTCNTAINFSQTDKTIVKAQPAARALAKSLNIDINKIKASDSKVIKVDDILQATSNEDLILPASRRHMCYVATQSNNSIMASTVTENIIIDKWYKKVDFLPYIIDAICKALLKNPALNAHYQPFKHYKIFNKHIDLGLAIQSDYGLFVPKITNAQEKSKIELRNIINQLKTQAKERTLKIEQMQDATFIVSNFGSLGAGLLATPMLTPPSVAILGLGRVHDVVKLEKGCLTNSKTLPISLTFDHRVVYGAEAILFIKSLVETLSAKINI